MKQLAFQFQPREQYIAATVRRLQVRCEREYQVPYGTDTWPGTLSDITLALLLERVGIRWRHTPLNGLCEAVWPPLCGIHVMHIDRCQTPAEKRFATRHGLAHVLAGHVADVAYRHDGHDWHDDRETIADVFALVDLFHDEQLRERAAAGFEVEHWIQFQLAKHYARTWTLERILDRVQLRLRLT